MSSYTVFECPVEKLDPYRAMIFAKWLRSLRTGNDYFRLVHPQAFYVAYSRYIQSILSRHDVRIMLATLSDDADVVLGFSVSRGTVLEYVHVGKDYRRLGIGKGLVPECINTITHLTRTGLAIWGKTKDIKFDPFA